MNIKSKTVICKEIEDFKLEHQGEYCEYYIGITNNPTRRLVEENELKEHINSGKLTSNVWYLANTGENKIAVEIEVAFQNLGMKEYKSGSKGKENTTYIYCFKLNNNINLDKENLKGMVKQKLNALLENQQKNKKNEK